MSDAPNADETTDWDDDLDEVEADVQPEGRPLALAVWLLIAGVVGLWAAFELTLDKFAVLTNPKTNLGCNFSVLVQCGVNLESWQGSVLGFPNPILGLGGWTATIAMGALLFAARGRLARWFWALFNVGVLGALVLVVFLIYSSIFNLHTLCPWCMVTWSVTIPTFWAVTFYNLKSGNIPLPASGRRFFDMLYGWTPLIAFLSFIAVALIAQVRLEWIQSIFHLG